MQINENSFLAVTNPFFLLAAGAALCFLAWFCARQYRNTNDFGRSVKLYLPVMAVVDVLLLTFLDLGLVLTVGLDICGFVVLALISNYYFYH